MTDLEKQLQASLPGRETAVQDHARAWHARGDLRSMLESLRNHRAELTIAIPAQASLHERLGEAILLLQQVHADIERVHLPRLLRATGQPAGAAPR